MSGGRPAALVTAGGGAQGLGLVRLLAEAGCRIVVADTAAHGMSAPLVDGYQVVPPFADAAVCLEALLELCRRERVGLVLPATDHELELLAASAGRFEAAGARVAVCELPLLRRLRDKAQLYSLLEEAGLPVLEVVAPAPGAALPLIGKPRTGWGSRGLIVARSAEQLERLGAAELAARVWQPFLEGAEEISADFAIGFDGRATPIGLRLRLRVSGGFAVASETVDDRHCQQLVEAFARLAALGGGRGCFNLQLLRSNGRAVLSDVNPRLGTSAVHWRGSGFNPLLPLCRQAGLLPVRGASGSRAATPLAAAGAAPWCGPRPARRSLRSLEETFVPLLARPRVEGVVLDLDDTLIPTKRFIASRLELALRAVAPAGELAAACRTGRRLVEEGPRDRLVDAVAVSLGWAEPLRRALLDAYLASWPTECPVHEDVVPALETLRRSGYRLAVLTDNPPATQQRKLDAAGLCALLDAVVFTREAGAEKPDRRGFAAAAERLGLPAARLAMAGDNPHRDLAGAAAAGYGRLFWVTRPGASCSFDPELCGSLPGAERFEAVRDLRELLHRLRD